MVTNIFKLLSKKSKDFHSVDELLQPFLFHKVWMKEDCEFTKWSPLVKSRISELNFSLADSRNLFSHKQIRQVERRLRNYSALLEYLYVNHNSKKI